MTNTNSKYWFIEDKEGNIDGFESLIPVTEQEVIEYMRSAWHAKVKAYPTTKAELYLSEVDIY